jgi:predicted RNA-binding protein (virulence factor B family)
MATIGQRSSLSIVRASTPGLYLDGGELGEILLPGRYVPKNLVPGMKLDVFIYLDSEDRLVATTEIPRAMVGEFAWLKVLTIHPRAGAFLDWGLSKDLLLPFREQDKPVRPGQWVAAYVYLDEHTKRIVASTRLHRHLDRQEPNFRDGQPVSFLITGQSPLGYNAIVENTHRGLLYRDNLSAPVQLGQKLQGFIRKIRPGGKLDLSLDASGYKRVAPLTERVLAALRQNGSRLGFDDDTPPEIIRAEFSSSKKAFKQALGALYKARRIRFTKPGIELLE